MGIDLSAHEGQTPLDEDEKDGLRIPGLTTRGELDEFEQQNIEHAIQWTLSRSISASVLFSEHFIRQLHKRMYGDVWTWAGEFRKTNKNLGVDKWRIATELRYLLDDVRYWDQNGLYTPDELALRFKHRIVSIHCFPNGNGRHSRLLADLIVEKIYHQPIFTWGSSSLSNTNSSRNAYIQAVKAADNGVFTHLLRFART